MKRNTINSRLLSSLEGECLFNSGDYSAAVYAFDAALSFPSEEELAGEGLLFENSLIPENWIQQKNGDFAILNYLTKSHKNKYEFDQCLEMIDRMIKINPKDPWLFLMGADFSMQLTDYELASEYLLKYKNIGDFEKITNDTNLFATALDYACAFLDGRDYRFSFRDEESQNDLRNVLNAHQLLDKNLFEDAIQLFNEIKPTIDRPMVVDMNDHYGEIKKSIFKRLSFILVWRLK